MEIKLLEQIFDADFERQKLFWKHRPESLFNSTTQTKTHNAKAWNSKFSGKEALTCISHGYFSGTLFNKKIYRHQVLFALYFRFWPESVDHIDGNTLNNSIDNLRNVSHKDNMKNRKRNKNNKSGFMNISLTKYGRYDVCVNAGKTRKRKLFLDLEQAKLFALKARIELGFHENHGRERETA